MRNSAFTAQLSGGFGWVRDISDDRDHRYIAPPEILRNLPGKVGLQSHLPPAYNQRQINSCTANAIAAALEFDEIRLSGLFAGQDSYLALIRNEGVPVTVHVTQMLVRHLNVRPDFAVDAKNLEGLLDEVDKEYHGFRDSICDESGRIRVYVNVFVNGQNVRQDSESLSTPLSDGDEIYILASVAGGKS